MMRAGAWPRRNLVAVAIAAAVVSTVGLVVASLWAAIGESEISGAGWLALGLGVVLTLGLGIGLMGLVFISNRGGYDEAAARATEDKPSQN